MADEIASELQAGDLIAVVGAGDVKEIIPPLRERLIARSGNG